LFGESPVEEVPSQKLFGAHYMENVNDGRFNSVKDTTRRDLKLTIR